MNHGRKDGDTPLIAACAHGHTEVVSALRAAGAAVDQASADGNTPLYVACDEGHLACVELLSPPTVRPGQAAMMYKPSQNMLGTTTSRPGSCSATSGARRSTTSRS